MLIREAVANDMEGITAIYNEVLTTSTAIFNDRPASVEDRVKWWQGRVDHGYPVLVAVEDGVVAGFASFGDFRSWPGYRFTVEHTVHVHGEWRGRGVGRLLMKELMERARAGEKHAMVGGVDAENVGSLRFHEGLGFERVGRFREVGYKFGRYLDLIFVQYVFGTPD